MDEIVRMKANLFCDDVGLSIGISRRSCRRGSRLGMDILHIHWQMEAGGGFQSDGHSIASG